MEEIKYYHRRKKHTVKPFDFDVIFHVTNDVPRAFKQSGLRGEHSANVFAFVWSGSNTCVQHVFIPHRCGLGSLAHEMFHVVCGVMAKAGVEFDEENWAYHLEDLVQAAANFVHNEKFTSRYWEPKKEVKSEDRS